MKIKIEKVLYLFVILLAVSGCKSSKMLSPSEAEELKSNEEFLVLHTQEKKYYVINYFFQEDKLIGDLATYKKPKGSTIHVHLSGAYQFDLGEKEYVPFELNYTEIDKMVYRKPEKGRTVALIIAIPATLFLAAIIRASTMAWN